ncbi:FmdB family zinc ribbon protein [Paratractidigestivibacter sp.]|uniref:FmdB family zinc ribbon protein n=1 Tax=Paratractidigestivibacter sp. TaxID=2847316 RepID=UPI002ABD74C2|nr:FmdB family zinc ribbon protein [Paratractidigestivibacter sp.]
MARYDYKCTSCETVFEVEHPMSEHPEVSCPACGEPAERVFGANGIVFSGSGFYNTDQRGGGCAEAAGGGCCEGCPNA